MQNPLHLSMVNYTKSAYIIVEGEQVATKFFIIRTGKVLISKEFEIVEEQDGNILGPGDFFGVISTMSAHSHIENAQALTDVTLIAVQKDQYGFLIEKNTPIAMKILQSFSRKMRYMDEALTKITLQKSADETPDHLFEVAEYYAKQNKYNHAYFAYYQYVRYCPNGEHINITKQRMAKIKPYSKAVHLVEKSDEITKNYPKDTMIFSEGQPGHELYIIQKGSVKITKIVADKEILIAILKTGDIFGEMALLENKPRSASAIAYEDASLMAINKINFERMVSQQPQMITRLTQLLSERIWLMYGQLRNTQLTNPLGRIYNALSLQLEKARVTISPKTSYTFNMGPKELLEMVGPMGDADGNSVINELFLNKKLKVVDNKVYTLDTEEIHKQATYYRKIEKINLKRKSSSASSSSAVLL